MNPFEQQLRHVLSSLWCPVLCCAVAKLQYKEWLDAGEQLLMVQFLGNGLQPA